MGFLLKVGGASSSCSILGNSVESVPESEPSWAQVVQGRRCFMWEMPRPSQEDISILEAKFNDLVVFSEVELQRTSKKWKTAAVGKFLGQGFPLEFVQKELKNRCSWRVTFSAWLTSSQRIRRLLRFSCTIPPTTRFRLFGACVYSFLILQLLLLQFSLCDWTHRMLSSDGLGERINTEAFSSLASLNSLISMNI
uniref:Uncharacterized protein LOC105040004 isoform X3 n=1 Tax=Elaeis guineensis var. tenera TaxID=51953 RepID=A0A6I9QT93_ELAGV|nr:uncharacterized protein LOC105040004 isoform X3 [Elaeis guineensis]